MSEREIVVAGLRSPLIEAGPADASDAVVFVHGNPGSSRDWSDLVAGTGEFARAVAFDMPGFGRADKPADFDYTVEGYARHLAAVLDELAIARVHVVLHDFGGPWGLAWAAAHPGQLASAVLINTGALIDYRWHLLARIWRTPVLGELFHATTTRFAFRALIRRGNPRPLPRQFVDRMYDEYDRATKRAVLRLYRATSDPDRYGRAAAAALHDHDRPALVVWGRHDPYLGVELVDRQRQVFASLESVILDESGHWPFADDPERTAAAVLPFLRRQVAQ